jgi:hypothetical protein
MTIYFIANCTLFRSLSNLAVVECIQHACYRKKFLMGHRPKVPRCGGSLVNEQNILELVRDGWSSSEEGDFVDVSDPENDIILLSDDDARSAKKHSDDGARSVKKHSDNGARSAKKHSSPSVGEVRIVTVSSQSILRLL